MVVKSKYGKEYEYDLDRSAYMCRYYKRNKATTEDKEGLLPKAIKRYRNKVTAKFYNNEESKS
jgi:hypothetical protein